MKVVRSAPFSNGSTNCASFSILQVFWSLGVDISHRVGINALLSKWHKNVGISLFDWSVRE